MMAVPLGSLVGSQAVHSPLTPETVDSLHLWTPDRIRALVLAALDRKEAEAERVLQVLIDSSIVAVLHSTQAFLGHEPDVSGGSIGHPRSPPSYVYVLQDCLTKALIRGCNSSWEGPPYSSRELSRRALIAYLWEWVNNRD